MVISWDFIVIYTDWNGDFMVIWWDFKVFNIDILSVIDDLLIWWGYGDAMGHISPMHNR